MHLHHELQRALADTKVGAGAPPLHKPPEDQPHAGGSRRPPRFRLPQHRRTGPTRPLRSYRPES